MSRRPRRQSHDRFQQTFELLDQAIALPPTRSIGQELYSTLSDVQVAAKHEQLSPADVTRFISSVNNVLAALPQAYQRRFLFDACMIGVICADWNGEQQRLSSTIYPRYDEEWSHGHIRMPTRRLSTNDSFLGFIAFPGTDDLASIELSDYSFLCHELGHNLLHYDATAFTEHFLSQLEQIISKLVLAGAADQGSARMKAQRSIDDIRRMWTPTEDHANWANEMMIDLIALWTCGPAYLASFEYEVGDESKNPYQISQLHPPYALRVEAMITASEKLGWGAYTQGLKKRIKAWPASKWKSHYTNKYVALADSKIVSACITCTLAACEAVGLPRCDERHVKRVKEIIKRGNTPDFGSDVIIAAWLVHQQADDQSFEQWEQKTVASLFDRIISQSAASNGDS
jgi:hypothetical protein